MLLLFRYLLFDWIGNRQYMGWSNNRVHSRLSKWFGTRYIRKSRGSSHTNSDNNNTNNNNNNTSNSNSIRSMQSSLRLMIDPLGFTGDMPELRIINAVVVMIGMIPIVFMPTIRIRIPIRMGSSTTRRFPLGTTQRMGIRPKQWNHISLHHVMIHDDTPVRREKHYYRTFTTKRVACRWWDIYVPNYLLRVLRH